ncbi:MAG: hypothetical protein ACUVTB_07900 [Candidatus Bathycorpusculaceae bacterium]
MENASKTKPKTPNTQNQTQDNITNVYSVWEAPRKPASFRCNEKLWKAFKQQIKANGGSICHWLEGAIAAYLGAANNKVNFGNTIEIKELHVNREVRRVRRYAKEYDEGFDGDVGDKRGRIVDFYDLKGGIWRKVKVEDDLDVNEHGHLVGCGCSVCVPNAKRVIK